MAAKDDTPTPTPQGAPRNPGRRMLLGGIPIAVTLASKPALAHVGQCSVSNALSGNLSHPLPAGINCGLTPAAWVSLAGTNQLWPRTAMYPQTNFSTACGSPGMSSGWTCGSQSLLAALQGSLVIQCKIHSSNTALNAQLFGQQVAASLLNAAAFSPNNYTKTLSQVQSMVTPIWSTSPSSSSQAQHSLDAVTTQLASLNINS
jgi:hypothetical protein